MLQIVKSKSCIKAVVTIVLLAFATTGFASGLHPARIMPTGKVSVYQGAQKVSEITAEAPLPEGYLLLCDGKCGLKMDGLYWVAADKSLFSVTTKADSIEFELREGTAYFALSEMPRPLVFITPHGVFTAQEAMINASTDGALLKGYVAATSEGTEIGIIEGGSLLISSSEGEKLIQSGNRIKVAQNTDQGTASAASGTKKQDAKPKTNKVLYGALGAAAAATIVLLIASSGGDDGGGGGGDTSPSSP
jgi:hypothetical protein